MPEHLPSRKNVLQSAEATGSADSSGKNQEILDDPPSDSIRERAIKQAKSHEQIEAQERLVAEHELERKLSNLELMLGNSDENEEFLGLRNAIQTKEDVVSIEQQVSSLHIELLSKGGSSKDILAKLISAFYGNPEVSTWVNNWKNFLRLHDFATTKPPAERKAITSIIATADFRSSTSFTETLVKIKESEDISIATKREITQKFDPSHITSIKDMDLQLKKIKKAQRHIRQELSSYKAENDKIALKKRNKIKQLKALPLDDPKRKKLEREVQNLQDQEERVMKQVTSLEAARKTDISFELRPNYHVELSKDGTRSIRYQDYPFTIPLPSNTLPFQGRKNIRSLNTAFVFIPLHTAGMTDILYRPPLKSGVVPSKQHRDMTHFILSHLGYNDDVILSASDIHKLAKQLATLSSQAPTESGRYNLAELRIYDKFEDKVDMERLGEYLEMVREKGTDLG